MDKPREYKECHLILDGYFGLKVLASPGEHFGCDKEHLTWPV